MINHMSNSLNKKIKAITKSKTLHCVLDCAFWEQKKFLTKAGSEPGTTRASSGGC